jgi:hypothetical protein
MNENSRDETTALFELGDANGPERLAAERFSAAKGTMRLFG